MNYAGALKRENVWSGARWINEEVQMSSYFRTDQSKSILIPRVRENAREDFDNGHDFQICILLHNDLRRRFVLVPGRPYREHRFQFRQLQSHF